jgi:glycosyltransferase involved in cell wall biosynthesis
MVLLASLFLKKKIIVCDRNNPRREHSRVIFFISCLLYSRATLIVVQTNRIKDMYPFFLKKKIKVIENPLDTEKLQSQLIEPVFQQKVIISMGRLEAQKDFRTLIMSFANVHEKIGEYILEIYGIGEKKDELSKLISSLGMEKKIKLMGRTDKPFNVLKNSKVFVLSSFYEGFPNVLSEAMYAGNVCIASDCVSGPSEMINDKDNGFLFEVGNQNQLQDILVHVCNMTDNEQNTYGEKAAKSIERLYLNKIIDRWEDVFEVAR